jgi:DNA helicase-2/ATP-dependent DNA helicase PcrA
VLVWVAMKAVLEKLNPQQQEAVLHEGGAAMVLAGAGSGKTTVLTTRAAWLLAEKKVAPNSLMVVTFTNKAAGEIRNRIQLLTGNSLPFSGTFHSLCVRILRRHGHYIGLDPNFVIYDTDDQKQVIKEIYKARGLENSMFGMQAVRSTISNAKNEIIGPRAYQEMAKGQFQTHVGQVYQWYQEELRKAQAVDFDDLLLKTLELLQHVPQARDGYQELIAHVLVDEYQDTNKVQYELTKIFTSPGENVYVVGDFSQSIFAWRGADYRNMLQLKQDFKNITEYRLEQNYRSNQNILDAATEIISQNTKHPILKLWTNQKTGNKITIYQAESSRDEARQVVKYIRQEHRQHPYSEMAILYRTNAQSREFEEAFIHAGIPYRLVGGTKFYERKEVKDVISYLRYFTNPQDTISLERIQKLGKRRLAKFQEWTAKWPEQTNAANNQTTDSNPASILKTILDVTGYLDKYNHKTEDDLSRIENIHELVNVAAQFDSVRQLLENIALLQDDHFVDVEAKNNQDAVNMMSLHSAKGLEFAVVFMVGMEDGLLPHSRSMLDPYQMEEERRLCYVGITRAKSQLYLSYARSRFQYGSRSYSLRSRFLGDIPEDLVVVEGGFAELPELGLGMGGPVFGKPSAGERRIVPVDEDLAEGVLSGDFDIDSFIDS